MSRVTSQPADNMLNQDNHNPALAPLDTVLIAEDSQTERLRFELILKKFGYRVISVANGREALEQVRQHGIMLILSDWQMPELSGLELCREIRADQSLDQPYFVLVTGHNTKTDLVAGMDAGADDFISKPFSSEELRVRLQAGKRMLQLRLETEHKRQQLALSLNRESRANAVISNDLATAKSLQQELLPCSGKPMDGIEVETLFQPAGMVSGDGLNFYPLDDAHLGFYLLDVTGHGVASAMLSFTIGHILTPKTGLARTGQQTTASGQEDIDMLPSSIHSPSRVVSALNRRFLDKTDYRHLFTMVYGVINVESGEGVLCQAGHPHPVITSSDGSIRKLGSGGFPVGMLAEATYEDIRFTLQPGERLYLYSDGLTEMRNPDGLMLNSIRLENLLQSAHRQALQDVPAQLQARLDQWRGSQPAEDDVSLMAIARQ